MFKITDLRTLGDEFSVFDKKQEKIIGVVQIIEYEELLNCIQGRYDEFLHGSMEEYLKDNIKTLSGFIKDRSKIMWHLCDEADYDNYEVINKAIDNGYTIIVLEFINNEDSI